MEDQILVFTPRHVHQFQTPQWEAEITVYAFMCETYELANVWIMYIAYPILVCVVLIPNTNNIFPKLKFNHGIILT